MTLEDNQKNPPDHALFVKVQEVFMEVVRDWAETIVIAHPVLLSPYWHDMLLKAYPDPVTHRTIKSLQLMALRVREEPWPTGAGPLDNLFLKVLNGEIAEKQALALAADPELIWRVSVSYVRRMSQAAERWGREGKWRDGVLLSKLVLALLDARRGVYLVDQEAMDLAATVHWLDVVTRAVCDIPDVRLFQDAVSRAERLADFIIDPDGYYFPAAVLHGLGIIYLDPYIVNRSPENYKVELTLWRERFVFELHDQNELYVKGIDMPSPAEAVVTAANYLRLAAVHRSGEVRGWTLKALLQALVWHSVAGVELEISDLEHIGEEAKFLLNKPDQEGVRAEIDNLLRWSASKRGIQRTDSISIADDTVELLLTKPLDSWLATMSPLEVLTMYTQVASVSDRLTAFRLWTIVQPIGWECDEAGRHGFCRFGLNLIANLYPLDSSLDGASSILAAIERLSVVEEPDDIRAVRLLALAVHLLGENEESFAISVLSQARATSPKLALEYFELLSLFDAMLLRGNGVNLYRAEKFDEAAIRYMDSVKAFLACDSPVVALGIVGDVVDLVERDGEEVCDCFVSGIGEVAAILNQKLPGSAKQLKLYYDRVMGKMLSRPLKPSNLMFLLRAAKGNAFSRALVHGAPVAWLTSDRAKHLESEISDLLCRGVALPETDISGPGLDFETILSAYVTTLERAGGTSDAERLRNLMISFEMELSKDLEESGDQAPWAATVPNVQEALGPCSALIAVYVGQLASGQLAIYRMLITQEFSNHYVSNSAGVTLTRRKGINGQEVLMPPLGPMVASLRGAIYEDPLIRRVSPEAARNLAMTQEILLGGELLGQLSMLRAAGKNHLYVWAHESLHFLPFHLIGSESDPLASQWNVTYLPSLQLLAPAPRHAAAIGGFVAIGLDFPKGNVRGFQELNGAEAEARELAKTMESSSAIVGTAVSKSAVIDAFSKHKRIHIASHGELLVSSPSFQTLYLSPNDAEEDLHAYEILRLDLRGVDMVTLSACETALGRIDIGDNLRGFAANLLIAGVSTIVGTLWSVETNCAKFFFLRLYHAIKRGVSKGAAFREAQIATRSRFPKHRDWGAFYLTGMIY